ncbi:MAG: DUF4160 domain-containing protein, partial [Coriobacteriales bacterium]
MIKLFFNDTGQHNKPHIHVYYGDFEAVIALDGELLEEQTVRQGMPAQSRSMEGVKNKRQ